MMLGYKLIKKSKYYNLLSKINYLHNEIKRISSGFLTLQEIQLLIDKNKAKGREPKKLVVSSESYDFIQQLILDTHRVVHTSCKYKTISVFGIEIIVDDNIEGFYLQ